MIHRDPKIGDISHTKDNIFVNLPFVAGVAVTVIMCIALLMPGGVSKAVGETLYAPTFGEPIYAPTFGEPVYETRFGEPVYETRFGEPVYETRFGKPVYEPKFLPPGRFVRGKYTPAERENPAYDRCAKLKEFNELLKCAYEAIGITQEEIKKAMEE